MLAPRLHTTRPSHQICQLLYLPQWCRLQLHQLPDVPLARLEDVRQVHSYVDELQRAADEEALASGGAKAVADIGDPGKHC
jgi:hypothetical protein